MASINHPGSKNGVNLLQEEYVSSDSDDDSHNGDNDDGDIPSRLPSHDASSGIDIDGIKSAKKVEHTLAHQVEAGGSILALVVDDDYLFAGLEGGDIAVCQDRRHIGLSGCAHTEEASADQCLNQVWSLERYEQVFKVHAHAESVLSLSLSEDKQLLFSSGVDSIVNVQLTLRDCPFVC